MLGEPRPGGGDQRLVMYYDREGDWVTVTKYPHWQGEQPVRPAGPGQI